MASQIKIMRATGDMAKIKTTADKVVRKILMENSM